jgi:hypothetical protein
MSEVVEQQKQLEHKIDKIAGDLIDALARIDRLETAVIDRRMPTHGPCVLDDWRTLDDFKLDGA